MGDHAGACLRVAVRPELVHRAGDRRHANRRAQHPSRLGSPADWMLRDVRADVDQ
jgi:hypothetical protein